MHAFWETPPHNIRGNCGTYNQGKVFQPDIFVGCEQRKILLETPHKKDLRRKKRTRRIQMLVNPKHGLENMHHNLPKRPSQSVQQQKQPHVSSNINQHCGKHTTMSVISFSLFVIVDLFAAKIMGYTFKTPTYETETSTYLQTVHARNLHWNGIAQ